MMSARNVMCRGPARPTVANYEVKFAASSLISARPGPSGTARLRYGSAPPPPGSFASPQSGVCLPSAFARPPPASPAALLIQANRLETNPSTCPNLNATQRNATNALGPPWKQSHSPRATDINECEIPSLRALCADNSECVNLPGHFVCKCKPGYQQAGQSGLTGECGDDARRAGQRSFAPPASRLANSAGREPHKGHFHR